jgi:hypothetical protein
MPALSGGARPPLVQSLAKRVNRGQSGRRAMCEDCETESLHETYARKRARMAVYWTPKRPGATAIKRDNAESIRAEPAKDTPRAR